MRRKYLKPFVDDTVKIIIIALMIGIALLIMAIPFIVLMWILSIMPNVYIIF